MTEEMVLAGVMEPDVVATLAATVGGRLEVVTAEAGPPMKIVTVGAVDATGGPAKTEMTEAAAAEAVVAPAVVRRTVAAVSGVVLARVPNVEMDWLWAVWQE